MLNSSPSASATPRPAASNSPAVESSPPSAVCPITSAPTASPITIPSTFCQCVAAYGGALAANLVIYHRKYPIPYPSPKIPSP